MVGSDPKIFRLRRVKNRVFGVFRVKFFPPAAGLWQSFLFLTLRGGSRGCAASSVFTSVGSIVTDVRTTIISSLKPVMSLPNLGTIFLSLIFFRLKNLENSNFKFFHPKNLENSNVTFDFLGWKTPNRFEKGNYENSRFGNETAEGLYDIVWLVVHEKCGAHG